MKDKTVLTGAAALATLFITSGLAFGAGGGAFGSTHTYVQAHPLTSPRSQYTEVYLAQPANNPVYIPPTPTWQIAPLTTQRPRPTFTVVEVTDEPEATETTQPGAPTITIPPTAPAPALPAPPAPTPAPEYPALPNPVDTTPGDIDLAAPPSDSEVIETLRPVITIPPVTTRPQ
ncbi:MAG: hypothetical protein GX542_05830 [Rhodococcus sp.]|nr:hypothetical protein [Rhodococcus sp. (in: high G+C Gram-positive bacteria)]